MKVSDEQQNFALILERDRRRYGTVAVFEDRYGNRSTIFASQLDSKRYHEYLGDPTVADAVCDRLIHNAHRVMLSGPSRRKEDASIK